MTYTFHKLLLSELHMVVYEPGSPADLTDRLLCEAVTVNENLRSLGFVLKPDDLIRLAVSPSLYGFYKAVQELVPDVKAQPMYPGFPLQVMQMSEAEMKWNQFVHTFSILGIEWLTGAKVTRGWMPDNRVLTRDQEDTTLLEAKVIELVSEADVCITVLKQLLQRRERLTEPALELVLEAAESCPFRQMQDLTVRFKENLELLFPMLVDEAATQTSLRTLRCICAHTGDVLRCTADYLSRTRYHLYTREKRLLVKLLESYPVWNFRQNLMQSQQLRERNLMVLRHLDYNKYSRSPEHRDVVRALRNKELLSWHGIGEKMLQKKDPEALPYLAQRPGYMLRMLNRLLSLGYEKQDILKHLLPNAGGISVHLLLNTIHSLSGREAGLEQKQRDELDTLEKKYNYWNQNYAIWKIKDTWYWTQQSLSRQLEQELRQLDEERREQLHALLAPCRSRIAGLQKKLSSLVDTSVFTRWPYLRAVASHSKEASGDTRASTDLVLAEYLPFRFRESQNALQAQIAQVRLQLQEAQAEEQSLRQSWQLQMKPGFAAEQKAIQEKHSKQLAQEERKFRKEMEEAEDRQKNALAYKRRETASIEEKYLQLRKNIRLDAVAVEILRELLTAHFRQAVTPLKGKKVYCDLKELDLKHSVLEKGKQSQDGGYIPSGIAWKIPENAKFVRFFLYWNDPDRVIIDLHAGGITQEGSHFHVGWNTYFHGPGVLHSGDVLHSDAAQYIDIDMSAPLQEVYTNIHLWAGKPGFRYVEECYVGMMAVDQIGQEVKLYSPKNCFFSHELKQKASNLFYGYVDVQNRYIRFVGQPNQDDHHWDGRPNLEDRFSLHDYLNCLLDAQQVQLVESEAEADLVLTMGKGLQDNAVSLVDHNFFLES